MLDIKSEKKTAGAYHFHLAHLLTYYSLFNHRTATDGNAEDQPNGIFDRYIGVDSDNLQGRGGRHSR